LACVAALAFESLALADELGRNIPSFASDRYRLVLLRPQRDLPAVRLFRLSGGTTELSFLRGKPVLLNFWATWCPACRTELPILDRLQKQNAERLHVLAVSVDRTDRTVVVHFIQELGLQDLPIFLDPNGYVAHSDRNNERNAPFALYEMPITYVIAPSGKIVGYVAGAADWTSAAASALVESLRTS
jgi:thiol-disulfide isomerase/thioredoxin